MSFDYDPTISKAPIAQVDRSTNRASIQPHDTSGDYLLYNRKTSESRIVSEADALILGGNTVQAFRALAAKLTEIHPAISVEENIFGGIPHIAGVRLSVGDVLAKPYVYGNILRF